MEIIKHGSFDNPLLKRKEIKIRVESDVTPSRIEAIKIVANEFSCSPQLVHVLRISNNFGTKTFTIVAHIYNTKEDKESIAVSRKRDNEAEAGLIEKPVEGSLEQIEESNE